ncbi:MAG: cysJ 2 [Verrucomicrobiales bacterium]|nr:cysJ 2 [Verrucomicrobiales bacterium]
MNLIPFIPETAPFTAEQRAWLNGFLAGLLAAPQLNQPTTPSVPKNPLLILFGSQTGTAEQLAKKIGRDAEKHGFAARVIGMNDFATVDLSKESRVLLVTSTWGDGDLPDNGIGFWNFLNATPAPELKHLSYSVLALGDSSYSEFCGAGKKLDCRLEQLGAKRIHGRADCDKDYDAAANAWIETLWPAFVQKGDDTSVTITVPMQSTIAESPIAKSTSATFTRANPFPARLVANGILNQGDKETRHFEISLEGSGLTYEAGDALGIFPTNCPELVAQIVEKLGWDGEEEVVTPAGAKTSLRVALQRDCEIHKIPRPLLEVAASGNERLRELLSPEKKTKLDEYLAGRDLLDLCTDFALKISAADFVANLRKLTPRLYSIASSPKAHAQSIHLTVAIVRRDFGGRQRKGLCSTFLAERVSEKVSVPVFLQTSPHFRPPQNLEAPMIMVGPGTGIAPFRAFLQERAATGASGGNWLFFGHQHAATDFFYRDELAAWQKSGVLTRLDTAFSRDQQQKIYVQNRMLENANELWAWLNNGAHFYVCGDASRMAKDVDAALHQIAQQAGQLTPEQAKAFIDDLRKTKRYQRDVY